MKNRDITYNSLSFMIDGKPLIIFGGEIQYYKLAREDWEDRIRKAKSALLNCITTYVPWSVHQPLPESFDFSGNKDYLSFIELLKRYGLFHIAKIGPYNCNETDGGGMPSWLWDKGVIMRSNTPEFLSFVQKWFDKICSLIRGEQITKGGNIILVQVENEYFWGNLPYLEKLASMIREEGIEVPIINNSCNTNYSTDLLLALDIYPPFWKLEGLRESLSDLRNVQPDKPMMIIEFQGGWMSVVGSHPPTVIGHIPPRWTDMLIKIAYAEGVRSSNLYMISGGTHFDYLAGKYLITSYDLDAGISEWGELRERYYYVRLNSAWLETFKDILLDEKVKNTQFEVTGEPLNFDLVTSNRGDLLFVTNLTPEIQKTSLPISNKKIGFPVELPINIEARTTRVFPLAYSIPDTEIKINYSAFEIFAIERYEETNQIIMIVYGDEDIWGEICLSFPDVERIEVEGMCRRRYDKERNYLLIEYTPQGWDNVVRLFDRNDSNFPEVIIIITNTYRAMRTWKFAHKGCNGYLVSNYYYAFQSVEEDNGELKIDLEQKPEGEFTSLLITPFPIKDVYLETGQVDDIERLDTNIVKISNHSAYAQRSSIELSLNDPEWKAKFDSPADNPYPPKVLAENWPEVPLGTPLEKMGIYSNGYTWYLYDFDYSSYEDEDLTLKLPEVNDIFAIFCNGEFISSGKKEAEVDIHSAIVRGENTLAVRVHSIGHDKDSMLPILNGIAKCFYLSRRARYYLNNWQFKADTDTKGWIEEAYHRDHFVSLNRGEYSEEIQEVLPEGSERGWTSTVVGERVTDLRKSINVDSSANQGIVWYRTEFELPEGDEYVILQFNDIDLISQTFVNGKHIGSHWQGWSGWGNEDKPYNYDITDYVKRSAKNTIAIRLQPGPKGGGILGSVTIELYHYKLEGNCKVKHNLFGQNEGWLEKGFDDSGWDSLYDISLDRLSADILWLRRKVEIPKTDLIAPLGLRITGAKSNIVIYWNGKMIGLYFPEGPQEIFYIPESYIEEENYINLIVEGYSSLNEWNISIQPYHTKIPDRLSVRFEG